jgi:hypothetical protein
LAKAGGKTIPIDHDTITPLNNYPSLASKETAMAKKGKSKKKDKKGKKGKKKKKK